jgi:DGQHR domain-containing protein
MRTKSELRLPALEVRQSRHRVLYSFAIDGKLLPKVTTISRIVRDQNSRVLGYQRPEVLSHIAEIRNYLESDNPMIPNAIVVAFDKRVRFEPLGETDGAGFSRPGVLVIPLDEGQADDL